LTSLSEMLLFHLLYDWDALKDLRKATISFEISVRPSVLMEKTRLPLDGFSWNLIFEYFLKNLLRKLNFH
jgi:hypothetical protein